MKSTFAVCILLAFLAVSMAEKPVPMPQKTSIPEYEIDLETDPRHRWDHIVDDFYDYNAELVFVQMSHVVPSVAGIVAKWINPWALEKFGDYGQEIIGVIERIKTKFPETVLTEGDLMVLNFLYSFDAGCTSVVAQSAEEGIVHGRNMDFGFTTGLRMLSMNITYKRAGKPIYTGTGFLGYTGIITGIRHNAFGISMDARHKDDSLVGNILRIALGYRTPAWLIRDVLDQAETYDEAKKLFSETKLAASMYFILSGPEDGQGTVLTRKPSGLVDDWTLNASNGEWYRLETNYDHWVPTPTYDNRRDDGNKHMDTVGADKINRANMLENVFSEKPTLRPFTVYTTIMSVKEDTYDTYLWWYY